MVASSDVNLEESFRRIAASAHRLINWRDFRILRLTAGEPRVVFTFDEGLLSSPRPANGGMGKLHRTALERLETIVVHDAFRDERVTGPRTEARSVVIAPLRFGDNLLGLLEIENSKRQAYGSKQLVVVERFAAQLSTTIQIQELRRPLAEALGRLEGQLERLSESTLLLAQRGR
jgi:GAF domain-containing protein